MSSAIAASGAIASMRLPNMTLANFMMLILCN
jgi:hypothetical protein